ncbi:MAG: thioredoxin domain-containing protein [Candidatus Dormiibacterota bacterium]
MTNRLADQSSPYLLQHAGNPVDWYPWGDEALSVARARDMPILLSVGYSACHWCHVMAHESFEDPAIAELMNQLFVCIKVDREERPDIDAVYMQAVQAMTGQGGWPMTVFLTPGAAPFFAGTYFPPEPRGGMTGFPAVLRAAHQAFRQRREDVEHAAQDVVRALAPPPLPEAEQPSSALIAAAVQRLIAQADRRRGGFGGAPKFPHPSACELLLRRGVLGGDGEAAEVVRTTLQRMLSGGIFDQLGGGFHRYSIDAEWRVPHFEKMLYDNAQLASLYLHAFQLTALPEYRAAAEATLDYLVRELRLPGGGFASAQDADSEGAEGRYYVWTPAEVVAALGDERDAQLACRVFGVTEPGNFDAGSSVLRRPEPLPVVAEGLGVDVAELADRLERIRARLLEARGRRVAPGRDAKVVTSWNALALRAFAESGTALGRHDHVEVARNCADFLLDELVVDGRVRRSWMEGRIGVPAFLDDVAGLGDALLAIFEATGEPEYFARAMALAEEVVTRFRDPEDGYWDTADDAEPLLVRPRGLEDNPVPAGRSAAAQLFARLAGFTGDGRWRDRSLEIVGPLTAAIGRVPLALGSLACVADQLVMPSREVAVVGAGDDPATQALLNEVWRRHDPYRVLAWGTAASVPLLEDRPLVDGRPAAYVCAGFSCRAPTTEPAELAAELSAG